MTPDGPHGGASEAATLVRFLPAAVAERVLASGGDELLATHRREIAVFVADIRGFTAFTEASEPEEVMALLGEFHHVVGDLVELFEATVGDFAGDGVMAYFNDPLPVADFAMRAVRMALELRERAQALRERWRRLGHDVDVGCGIAVGHATMGWIGPRPRVDYKAVGTVVNLAARLCAEAGGGEILLSQRAYAAVDDVVAAEPAGEFVLKGLHRPQPAYRLQSLRPEAAGSGAVLVGRDDHLGQLEASLKQAAAGVASAVLVCGEPGIGKTRLVEELATRATRAGAAVAWGRCSEREGAPAFWPWMQVVGDLADHYPPGVVAAALGPGAGAVAQIVPQVKELVPDLEPPPVLDPDAARFRLYDAVAGFVTRLGAHRTVVVALDDLQWADVPSLELLSALATRLGGSLLLVVGTYRDVDPVVGPPLSDTLAELARVPTTTRIQLRGLAAPDVGRLIGAATGADPPAALVARVHDRTEGNPFFVGELLRLLDADDTAAEGAGARATAVPHGVRDVLRRRLSRLPASTTKVLSAAAVVGREVDVELLAAIAGTTPPAILDALEPALEARLVEDVPAAPGRYRFSHALVVETLYEELRGAARARIHARVGEALEERHGDDPESAAAVAHHFFLGLPAADVERAVRHALRAAAWAQGRLAYEQAEGLLRRARDLVSRLPAAHRAETELEVQLHLGELLTFTEGYGAEEVGAILERARVLCRQQAESPQLVPVLLRLAAFHTLGGELGRARQVAEELLQVALGSGRPTDLAAAHNAMGFSSIHLGELGTASSHLDQALALPAEVLDDPQLTAWFPLQPVVSCLTFQAWTVSLLGDRERAERLAEDAVRIGRADAHDFSTIHALHFRAWVAATYGDVAATAERARMTFEEGTAKGFGFYVAMSQVLLGWTRAHRGEADAGVAEIEAGLAALRSARVSALVTFFLALLADAHRLAGRPEHAAAVVAEALELAAATGERFWEAELHRLQAELLLALPGDRRAEAQTALATALSVARAQGARALEDRALETSRRLALGTGATAP